jgi:DNA processing protein
VGLLLLLQKDRTTVSPSQLVIVLSHFGLTIRRYQIIVKKYGAFTYEIVETHCKEKEFSWLQIVVGDLALKLEKILQIHTLHAVSILTIGDIGYPEKLKEIDDSPLVLYYQGDITLLQQYDTCLTVIGSRNNSKYSEMVMEQILPECISDGLVVVSGLAEGVDGLAHKTAIAKSGKTIAVIGSGLDDQNFYPKSNLKLRTQIIDTRGLILSEYPIGTAPKTYHFPQRNRILAALSPVLWVVEASIKSGSMTTVRFAEKYNKKILTNPGNLLVDQCSGNIELMKQGAVCVFDAKDIISLYGVEAKPRKITIPDHPIFTYFTSPSMSVDELLVTSQLPFTQLNSELSMAELEGFVKHLGENVWQKNSL